MNLLRGFLARLALCGLLASVASAVAAAPGASDAGPGKPVAAKTARDGAAAGIDWFDGTVDEAFAAAARARKPVFLYWGAEWCPPCHAINNTVFRSAHFIARSRSFVPVYLDGDTPNAQAAGDRFNVQGYPTMIVFAADGAEITRIPGGIDLTAYANVLDLALDATSPVAATVTRVLDDAATLAPSECTQLAYYSWGQDPVILADRDSRTAFRRMFEACPDGMNAERSVLYFSWLGARLGGTGEDGDDAAGLAAPEAEEARAMLNRVLTRPELIRANVLTLELDGARFTAAVSEPGSPERAQLERRFLSAYDGIFADDAIYKRERLYALTGKIRFARIDDPDAALPEALVTEIEAAAEWADESTPDPYERQPVINAVANVLEEAGMDELAKDVLTKEIGISAQAYYFMPALADIEQRAGNDAAALDWLRKGWETSKGPATRFQWGSYYLHGLLDMAPDDVGTIRSVTVALVGEVLDGGGFYHRPKAQLEGLGAALAEWSETNDAAQALKGIRAAVADVCARDREDASRSVCESFLDAA